MHWTGSGPVLAIETRWHRHGHPWRWLAASSKQLQVLCTETTGFEAQRTAQRTAQRNSGLVAGHKTFPFYFFPNLPTVGYRIWYDIIIYYIYLYMRYKVRQLNSQSGYVQFSVGSTWISYNKMTHAVHQRVIQDSHLNVPYSRECQSISTGCPNLQQPLKFLQLWTESAAFSGF